MRDPWCNCENYQKEASMKYPSREVRLTHEQATKTLVKMCERLDACATVSVDKSISRFDDSPPGPVTALRMWVVGSFARGASSCGDIDVVLEVDNFRYGAGRLNQLLFKSPQRVSLYVGTPEKNPSGVQFEGAVLVWESGRDWRSTLAAIKVSDTAGHFERPTDEVPLRLSQIGGKPWEFESLISLRKQEIYDWKYVPLDGVESLLGDDQGGTILDALNGEAERWRVGKDNRRLLPYLSAYVQTFGTKGNSWTFDTTASVKRGTTLFLMGVPPDDSVFDMPGVSEVVVVPHLNTRGPNGFWVLRRGRKHMLTTLFKDREAWLIVDGQDVPVVIQTGRWDTASTVDAIEVFATEESARKTWEELYQDEQEVFTSVTRVQGDELLDALGYCDLVEGDYGSVVFSPEGQQRAIRAGFEDDEEFVRISLVNLVEQFAVVSATVPEMCEAA